MEARRSELEAIQSNWANYQGVAVLPTPDGVWHRDSHDWRKFIGGGTQHTDFNKGFTKRFITKIFGEDFGGVRGTATPCNKNNEQIMEKSLQISNWTKSIQKSNQNQFGEGLGLYLGRVWDALRAGLGSMGCLLGVLGAFRIDLFSSMALRWGPKGRLNQFWFDFGKNREWLGGPLRSL